jgi:hypothetical protein
MLNGVAGSTGLMRWSNRGYAVKAFAISEGRLPGAIATRIKRIMRRQVFQRPHQHAERFLRGFRGQFLQVYAYEGYDRLARLERPQGPWSLVHCWAHLRRRFVKLARNTKSPIAEAAIRQIAALYAIEATVRGVSPQLRLAARREHSAPIITALKPWFEKQLSLISSGSRLAEDIRYGLAHWEGLTRFWSAPREADSVTAGN